MSGVLEPFIFLLELLFFEHKPRSWVRRSFRACHQFCQRVVLLVRRPGDLTPKALRVATSAS
jgi:hypothetical protein